MDDDFKKKDENSPGAEGGEHSESKDRPPAAPAGDDESPLGDTDQHSNADA